eukprot:1668303-Prymnesium_polylepis.1
MPQSSRPAIACPARACCAWPVCALTVRRSRLSVLSLLSVSSAPLLCVHAPTSAVTRPSYGPCRLTVMETLPFWPLRRYGPCRLTVTEIRRVTQ